MGKIQQSFNTALGTIGALSLHYQRVAQDNLKQIKLAKKKQEEAILKRNAEINKKKQATREKNKIDNQEVRLGGEVYRAGDVFNKEQLKSIKGELRNGK